jgi:hypothetical protein
LARRREPIIWCRPPGAAPAGKKWIEVTQARDIDPAYARREAIFRWEAKVYTYASAD